MLHNNADQIKFRSSGLGYIMSDGNNKLTEKQLSYIMELQGKEKRTAKQEEDLASLIHRRDNPELAQGVKTHLVDVYVSARYGRREEITSKFLDKGNEREEDSLTLLSRVAKKFFKKNTERLDNAWIQGEPDTFIGESIRNAKETLDTKTSWSAHTFFRAQKTLDPMYYWQGQGYMDLTGASKHTVAYCLVNGTAKHIMDEKRRLSYAMGIVDPDVNHPEYKKRCRQIEINHIFDIKAFIEENPYFEFDNDTDSWEWDIPKEDRLFLFEFDRNQSDIDRIHKRVEECRQYMNSNLFKIV